MVRKIMRLITAGVVSLVFALPFVTTTTATATQKPIVTEEEKPKDIQEKEEVIEVAETADAASTTVSLDSPEEMSNESAPYIESEEVVLPIPEPVFDPEAVVDPEPEAAPTPDPIPEPAPQGSPYLYSPSDFMVMGVLNWGGYRWTWYSQRVLPGGGLNIPGRHVDGNGYVSDGEGYICLASNDLPYGTVVDTPLGKPGRVYDCGCASGTLDVYVNW